MATSPVHGDKPTAASLTGLRDFKELAAAAFERTRMPLVLTDARQQDCPIVLANQAFLDLTGHCAEDVIGRNCRFMQGSGTSCAAVAELRSAVADGREANVELLNYRKDGTPFWNQLHLSPIRDDDGDLAYYFASQVDVTEYRKVQRLEASEQRLLMEVNHRSNNVLAIVDSIVRLSNADHAAAYASSVQQRVQSLAQAHTLLSHAGWKSVPLRMVIDAQVAQYGLGNIMLNGPDLPISANSVQPLSLVFHELVVNAATHGSLSPTKHGTLAIDWAPADHHSGFRLEWRETGGSLPQGEQSRGFGTVIVGALVKDQLNGTITRRWSDDGLTVQIEIPAT